MIKETSLASCLFLGVFGPGPAHAHMTGGEKHLHYDWSVKPPEEVRIAAVHAPPGSGVDAGSRPPQALPFLSFAPGVTVRWDRLFLYVGSNGMPLHNMMVGITNWQQQVPLPQDYSGENTWRIPRNPVPAAQPAMIKGRFLRGAIALAVNGIPIFNPQNNRGEISQEIGELDPWGGHCGRADDYHYHVTPLHLQEVVGKGMPVAYALDGYPVYGLTEPDGSSAGPLDECHGHESATGYHYHGADAYPYVFAGFHGEVVEREGQVDPQPRASAVRPAGQPLRGAKITGFETVEGNGYRLSYEVNSDKRSVLYRMEADGKISFEFQNGREGTGSQVYTRKSGGGGAGDPQSGRDAGPKPGTPPTTGVPGAGKVEGFVLTSPVVDGGGTYPVEYTGDGAGISPPLSWKGVPAGTQSLVLVMHHLDPGGKIKIYWTLHGIAPGVSGLEKNNRDTGTPGLNTIKNLAGYAPPHSKGPGPKNYVLTLYALSEVPKFDGSVGPVAPAVLFEAMKGHILAGADLKVVYSREGAVVDRPAPYN